MSRTKYIHGVGLNDADYIVKKTVKGREVCCPYYSAWKHMLSRCYSKKLQDRCPTYKGCSVCGEWLYFMNFRAWMIGQDWKGKQLDKDIIKPYNKIYSPENCVFVDQSLNKLLTNSAAIRGKYPQGVYLNKNSNKYQAYIKIEGIKKSLGYFNDVTIAAKAYIKAKYDHILSIASKQTDERVKAGLMLHAEIMKAGY